MRKVEWKDIKIGESFYYYGCEGFGVKISIIRFMIIDGDAEAYSVKKYAGDIVRILTSCRLYRLPNTLRECLEAKE